jgi:hypothetical protein
MPESDLLLQTLTRIEAKVDALPNTIAAHGERVARLEQRVDAIEDDRRLEKYEGWFRHGLTYLAGLATHFGITKIGWKI